MNYTKFKRIIWGYYRKHGRDFAWRQTHDPYKILVSEIMLQQTQTSRVLEKYTSFLKKFPTLKMLAKAPLRNVLLEWQGLGYNRRALFLKRSAEVVMRDFSGSLPPSFESLRTLPGIGNYMAAAITVFAFGKPTVMIETNIRAVYIHFFKRGVKKVHDEEIRGLIEKTMDTKNIREWFYALMDYGAMLKRNGDGKPTRSIHYKKQSPFKGSLRQIRSNILRVILKEQAVSRQKLARSLSIPTDTLSRILTSLTKEGLIRKHGTKYTVARY